MEHRQGKRKASRAAWWVVYGLLVLLYGHFFGVDLPFWLIVVYFLIVGVLMHDAINTWKQEESTHISQDEREKREIAAIRQIVRTHMDTLARKKRILVRRGDYGEVIDDAWRKEIKRFLLIKINPLTYSALGGNEHEAGFRLESLVDEMVSDHLGAAGAPMTGTDVWTMDGLEYEAFCGEILEAEGWKVQRTPPTGDHGVDLIADKLGRRVAIQCKKYSTPVGNKAVQEAYSGMKFFDATEAVVVTNSTFTQAAQMLANKLSVALKHHDDLRDL
jgi:restriction system protein